MQKKAEDPVPWARHQPYCTSLPFMDFKEAVQATLQQIEEDDEAAFGTDFANWFKAQKGFDCLSVKFTMPQSACG